MVILLSGNSAMGRAAIAEKVTEMQPNWKHLALEVIQEMSSEESEEKRLQHLEIVKRCVEELAKDDLHLILTMPYSREHVEMLKSGLDGSVAIHVGEGEEEGFDYVFDGSVSSMKDIATFIQHLIGTDPENE
jgi:hypothetical protein